MERQVSLIKTTLWPVEAEDSAIYHFINIELNDCCLSVLFLGCNLDATEETYNKDPTVSIHPKIIPLYLMCCL